MKTMKHKVSAQQICIELIPDPELGGFTACIPDIPAYGEGATEEEAIADLKEALALYIEVRGVEAALDLVAMPSKVCFVDWDLHAMTHA